MLVGTDDWSHGCSSDPRSLDFPCGSSSTLCLREDILDMENAARQFEQDKVVLHEVQQRYRKTDDFSLLLNMFPRAEEDGYVPYCEINFEWSEDSVEQTIHESAPNASASLVSDLDSPMEPEDNLSAGVNVSNLWSVILYLPTFLSSVLQKKNCFIWSQANPAPNCAGTGKCNL